MAEPHIAAWQDPPIRVVRLTRVERTGIAGSITLSFTGAGVIYAHGRVKYGEHEWSVTMHFTRTDDGTWQVNEPGFITRWTGRRHQEATPFQFDRIVVAVAFAIADTWTPELDVEARRAKLHRDLFQVDNRRAQLQGELQRVMDERVRLLTQLAAVTP